MSNSIVGNGRRWIMAVLFPVTLFLSAGLLFWLEPMVGKMLLPALGGTPAVWNTCMLFFQAGLLLGYAYAHGMSARVGVRAQRLLHVGLLSLPLLSLPILLTALAPPLSLNPVVWLLGVLLLHVGPAFVLLASTAPLLQKWFADTAKAHDPYHLYAASNLGSLVALLGYPFLIEPCWTLAEQSALWTGGYCILLVLVIMTAVWTWVRTQRGNTQLVAGIVRSGEQAPRPNDSHRTRPRWRWLLLALVPSSLMLSVTSHLTTDLAPIPLLWVLPLALYLLTFVLSFARRQWLDPAAMNRIMPVVVLILVLVYLLEAQEPLHIVLGLDLIGFFVIALVCHGELARSRPPVEQLTEFYFWLALGGVLGGLLNSLLAPLLFDRLTEYPLMLVAACLLRPSAPNGQVFSRRDLVFPGAVGLLTAGLVVGSRLLGLSSGPPVFAVVFGLPLLLAYLLHESSLRFGLAVGMILLVSAAYPGIHGPTEYRARSFFAAHRVTRDKHFRYLVHGNTVHGQQSLRPSLQGEPLTYYHRDSPIGKVFAELKDDARFKRVGLIGLGTGALACYAEAGQRWTFFEIDAAVIHIARDSTLFTYLSHGRGDIDVQCGDGRLLVGQSRERFGLLVIDAFNSDAIPLHLLTREALAIYRSRLQEGGILAFHISNRYVDLEPILANLAAEGPRPMLALARRDLDRSAAEKAKGYWASHWVLLVSREEEAARFRSWRRLSANPALPVWTDDFSSLLPVLDLTQSRE